MKTPSVWKYMTHHMVAYSYPMISRYFHLQFSLFIPEVMSTKLSFGVETKRY